MERRARIEKYLSQEKWYTAIDCLLDYCEGLEHRLKKLEAAEYDRNNQEHLEEMTKLHLGE